MGLKKNRFRTGARSASRATRFGLGETQSKRGPSSPTIKLKKFQLEGVHRIYCFGGRALLADEMGLGKTIQALYWLTKIPSYRPAMIVCPASVKYTWQSEAMLHFGMRTTVLEGHRKKDSHVPEGVIIVNYDILPSWLPLLKAAGPRVVIGDEIQFIKNLHTQRTKAFLKLCRGVPSVVGLSGTPMVNRPVELFPVLLAIRPDLFPDFDYYGERYCGKHLTYWGWKYDRATHVKELRRILLHECMIRRRRRDVLPELPEKDRRIVVFKLKSYKEYNEATRNFIRWLRKKSPTRARKAEKNQALTKLGYLIRLVSKLKLEWTEKWIEEFFIAHPGKKLVAFTMHTFVIDHLREKFSKQALVIDGRVRAKKREETVRQFQQHPRKTLLLGNWIAAGVGITLTAAHNVAALDFPWTPGDLAQGLDRVDRIGQKFRVIVHYLAAMNTIEMMQVKILRKKSNVLDAVLDGKRRLSDVDIFDELVRELKQS